MPKRPALLGYDSPTVSRAEFVDKIKTALDARRDAAMVIIARSELKGEDKERDDRLQEAVEIGADAFWFSTSKVGEMKALRARMGKPGIGVLPGGLTAQQFESAGARLCVLPAAMAVAALLAQKQMLEALKASGTPTRWLEAQPHYKEINTFFSKMGAADV